MRRTLYFGFIVLLVSCNNSSDQKAGNAAATVTEDKQSVNVVIEGRASCLMKMEADLALCSNIPEDADDSQLELAKAACDTDRGYEWLEEPCPNSGALGYCDKNAGGRDFGEGVLQYYYGPAFSIRDARGMCSQNGGVFHNF